MYISVSSSDFDDGQPVFKEKRAADRDDKIFKELHQLRKHEKRNGANIKVIVRKLMEEEEDSEAFAFPLRREEEYGKFKKCLTKNRFTIKLVRFLLFLFLSICYSYSSNNEPFRLCRLKNHNELRFDSP